MNRQLILSKIINEEDKLLVAKMLDKIELSNKRNSVEYTDFLDLRQSKLLENILKQIRYTNYILFGGYKDAERTVIIIYPDKLEDILKNNKFDYNTIMGIIRIKLPNELEGMYAHRNYLSGIIKIGIRREKVGDILVKKDGADIIVLKENEDYIIKGLQELTRFSKSKFSKENIENILVEEPKIQKISIIIPSMRIDSILSELIKTSRSKALQIIKEERVFLNHELVFKGAKEIKINDIITVRGKGRFKVGDILNTTKKGNLVVEIEKFV